MLLRYWSNAHFIWRTCFQELREAFEAEAAVTGSERLLLSAAVAASKSTIDTAYDVPVLAQ
jgi:chitinase